MLHRAATVVLVLSVVAGVQPAAQMPAKAAAAEAAHVLSRLTYGPRPGDVDAVQRLGIEAFVERQLRPQSIADTALQPRLDALATLDLDETTMLRDYFEPARRERRQRSGAPNPDAADPPPARAAPSMAQRNSRLIIEDLETARLLRAVSSERQLEEVLVDFWFNHFNVFAGKGPTRAYVTAFERDAIRPHVLGNFREMLEAVATSPAMLFYLDNWMNGRGPQAAAGAQRGRGINENYARELLELHTLGVDGGYTQADVANVARAFTGWTMRPREDARFRFAPAMHDRDAKVVLGHRLAAGRGIEDGRQVLDILAAHPSTARFIATRLTQKFVSDTPPPALIDRVAARFTATHGDLREVTRAVLLSPEFRAPAAYRAKVKTPLEFIASALRATGAQVTAVPALTRTLRDLGQPLYFCQPPTGYDETATTWVSSGALIARMNFAVDLANGRVRDVTLPSSPPTADDVIVAALAGEVSSATRDTLARAATPAQKLALVIGSPEFQRQ
ncbi:MAG: DUF1800 domain-containing protein [Acidobacteria bacterium]|nr:DUF1800 domain-containing protein [Acidobacteriota bacterium]